MAFNSAHNFPLASIKVQGHLLGAVSEPKKKGNMKRYHQHLCCIGKVLYATVQVEPMSFT